MRDVKFVTFLLTKSKLICGYGEMANTLDSDSSGRNSLQVQVLLSAPKASDIIGAF